MFRNALRNLGLGAGILSLILMVGCSGEPNYERSTELPPDAAERVAEAVKVLTEKGTSLPINFRKVYCDQLAKYGKAAEPAIPILEKMASSDPDATVQKAAKDALDVIKGGGAPATP